MGTYRKDDVEFHSEHWGDAHAAVDVKHRATWAEQRAAVQAVMADMGASLIGADTLDDLIDAMAEEPWLFEAACEYAWEQIATDAADIFGPGYSVTSEGRSGGWAIVTYHDRPTFDRDDVASWDAIALARWARFERLARALADDLSYSMADIYLANVARVTTDIPSLQAAGVGF